MTRVLLYLRQSDSRGEGEDSLSLDSQNAELRRRAAREGWVIVEPEIRDPDLKGWDEHRPGLAELERRAKAGECDALLFWDSSRFARDLRLQLNVEYRLRLAGVRLVSHTEPWFGADDPFVSQIMGAANEHRTREIAAHVRRAIAERTARGLHWSTVPFGYRKGDDGRLEPDPSTSEIVRQIFTSYSNGTGIAAIADGLTARGIPAPAAAGPWRLQTVNFMLANPAYRGTVSGRSGAIQDAHEPIVDAETWDRVRARLAGKARGPKRKPYSSWIEGRILHGCGQPMYLTAPYGRMRGPAFRCQLCRNPRTAGLVCDVRPCQVMVAAAEAAAWELVVAALARIAPAEKVHRHLLALARKSVPVSERQRREIAARAERARERRARAESLYLDGGRDRAWFDAEDARLSAELASAEAAMAALPAEPDAEDLRATERRLRDLAQKASEIAPADRERVLARLGVVWVDTTGVGIRWHAEVEPFLRAVG